MIHVQFTDETKTTIAAVFNCEQDPAVYANLGSVYTHDEAWREYFDSLPLFIQAEFPVPTVSIEPGAYGGEEGDISQG